MRAMMKLAYSYLFRTYGYRVWLTQAKGLRNKLPLLFSSLWRTFIDRRKILFYPQEPLPHHVIYKILKFLGYHVTNDPSSRCVLAFKWWRAPDGNPFPPQETILSSLQKKLGNNFVLNNKCEDITKERVAKVFGEVFGYSLSIDPHLHKGKCVMKTNWNALHLGRIIDCPIAQTDQEAGFVYQRLIQNEVEGGFVEDIRVPVLGGQIPFVYVKRRLIENRFIDRDFEANCTSLKDVEEILTQQEVDRILLFCKGINLDYCELDVLRDNADGRIYIVDANCCPAGPPSYMSEIESKNAVLRLAKSFQETFQV